MSGLYDNVHIVLPAAGAAATAVVGALTFVSIAPRSRAWGEVVYRGSAIENAAAQVALTFDDGPTEGSTDRVLDTLGEMNVQAAFFVVGANVERWPWLVERMHDEGHVVANHSFDHSHYGFFRGRQYWDDQIGRTDRIIEQLIGRRPALFRPPMGVKTWCIAGAAREAGHTVVTWTRRGLDGVRTTPEKICGRLAPRARPGDVLVLHDGVEPHSRRDPRATVAALRPLIDGLRRREMTCVRLDALIGTPPYAHSESLPVTRDFNPCNQSLDYKTLG